MKLFGSALLAACLLSALIAGTASAKNAAPTALAAAVPRLQAQTFALGYALRVADSEALAYAKSVQSLKGVTDPEAAGAEVAHLSGDIARLRRAQTASYRLVTALLGRMGAPSALHNWAALSAARLAAPLAYSEEAAKLAKKEPSTAAVLAELTEIRAVKAASDAQQTPLTLWLTLTGGPVTPWTADVGAYAADLRRVSAAAAPPSRLVSATAQALLHHARPDSPAAARESLATLIPQGGGNLQNLSTLAPGNVTPDRVAHVYQTLLALYDAQAQADTLAKDGT